MSDDIKRERGQNWTQDEKLYLMNLVKQNVSAIENKSVESESLKTKQAAWNGVYDEFCQQYGPFREIQRVREQWRRMKIGAKNEYKEFEKAKLKGDGSERGKIPSNLATMIHDIVPDDFRPHVLLFSEHASYPSMIGVLNRAASAGASGSSMTLQSGGNGLSRASSSSPTTPVNVKSEEEESYFTQDDSLQFQEGTAIDAQDELNHISPTQNQQTTSTPHLTHQIAPSPFGMMSPFNDSRIEQEVSKLRLRERKRKLEMMEEEHNVKMKLIRAEKFMEQSKSNSNGHQSSSSNPSLDNITEQYRNSWQRQNHHSNRASIDWEILKMHREEHKRRMEVLEEQHAAKMSIIEMEKDLVSMKIEAFMNQTRQNGPPQDESEQNADSDH